MILSKKKLAAIGAMMMLVGVPVMAATTGTEFQGLYDMLVGWATGYLGKALAVGAFIVGAVIGFSKGTAMPALVGLVFAIVLGIGPGVIDGMLTALI